MFSSDLTKQKKKKRVTCGSCCCCWHEVNKWIHPNPEGKSIVQERFGITGIPERLRYSADSSNTFMRKQRQVSGAALAPASVRLGSSRTSGLAAVKGSSGDWQRTRSQSSFTETDARLYEPWHLLSTRLCVTFLGQPALPGRTWNRCGKKPPRYRTHANAKCVHLNCRWTAPRETGCDANRIFFCIHLWSSAWFWRFRAFDGWSLKLFPLEIQ